MKKEEVLFHIPHSSPLVPEAYAGDFNGGIGEDIRRMTDWYTDELFDTGFGSRLVFPVSRLVCDPERFREDGEEEMARIGMGAVYTHGYDLRPIRAVTPERREEILRAFYDPHHRRLEKMTADLLDRYGRCLVVDCHSFSREPLPYERDGARPDFCLGTDALHTPEPTAARLESYLAGRGYSVCRNRPFSGTMVPLRYYGKDLRVSSVMLEVNRGLYLSEDCGKGARFGEIARLIGEALCFALEL